LKYGIRLKRISKSDARLKWIMKFKRSLNRI